MEIQRSRANQPAHYTWRGAACSMFDDFSCFTRLSAGYMLRKAAQAHSNVLANGKL